MQYVARLLTSVNQSSDACLMLAARRLPSIDLYQNYVVIDFSVRSHMLRTTSVFEKQMRIGGSTCYSGASRLTTHDSHLTTHDFNTFSKPPSPTITHSSADRSHLISDIWHSAGNSVQTGILTLGTPLY